jgi:hypothetical protein
MLDNQVRALFDPLTSVEGSIPPRGSMTKKLNGLMRKATSGDASIDYESLALFAKSGVEMWLRGVHSFLVSSSLTDASPLWASVCGYYASHYAVRGLAHLLGYYNLRQSGHLVSLQSSKSGYVLRFTRRRGNHGREHTYYWECVKNHTEFQRNPLFTSNPISVDVSDVEHRNLANYVDLLNEFPNLSFPQIDKMKERIDKLSKMEFQDPPIPNRTRYPDTTSVQVVAYHRLVAFRRIVDNALIGQNRFWYTLRTPSWCLGVLSFQCTEPKYLEVFR